MQAFYLQDSFEDADVRVLTKLLKLQSAPKRQIQVLLKDTQMP